jgi:hypothetical protein
MKYRLPIAFLLFLAFIAGAWMLLRPPELADLPPVEASATTTPAAPARTGVVNAKLDASSVLSIDPRGRAAKPGATPRATLFREFLVAKSYKALYDRLKNSPEGQTPEGWYVQYEILRKCATITDRTSRAPIVRTTEQRRDEFMANLSPTDPLRDKRIAAYEDVTANRCAGMEGTSIAQADLNKMLANAAAGGDPKAQALTIEQQLWAARRAAGPENRWGRDSVTVSDDQVSTLRQVVASRDPEAMVIAGRVFSNSWSDFSMRIGADGQVVEQRAFNQAWQLLACDYGYPCGADNQRVLSACAYQGHCDTQSLADYLYYYGSTPHDSQLMSQYREVLRQAIESGDWSQVNVVRGPPPPGSRAFTFRPGPG